MRIWHRELLDNLNKWSEFMRPGHQYVSLTTALFAVNEAVAKMEEERTDSTPATTEEMADDGTLDRMVAEMKGRQHPDETPSN